MRRDRPAGLLVGWLRAQQVAVVEAGPGYGKTSVLEDTAALWPHEAVWVAGDRPERFAAAVAAAAGARPCPDDSVAADAERLADLLAQAERALLLVVDDAHLLAGRARTLVRLAERLPARHRLLVATRGDHPVLDDLPAPALRGAELLLDEIETADALAALPPTLARQLIRESRELAGGWPEGLWLLARAAGMDPAAQGGRAAMAAMLQERLSGSDARPWLEQALDLPLWSRTLLAEVLGEASLLEAALAARLPLTRDEAGWWAMPAALRELGGRPRPARAVALAAAGVYRVRGRTQEALTVLARAGVTRALATLLEEVAPEDADALDLTAAAPPVTAEILVGSPRAGLRLLRHHQLAGQAAEADRILESLERAVPPEESGELGRLVAAESARRELWRGDTARARVRALALLRDDPAPAVRALALEVLGRAARRRGGPEDRAAAAELLTEALVLWRRLGERGRVAELRLRIARLDWERGHPERAAERAGIVAAGLPEASPLLVRALALRAEALVDLARWDEALQAIARARHLATIRSWGALAGGLDVVEARLRAYRRPRPDVLGLLHRAESRLSGALDAAPGLRFLTEAAELAALVGRAGDARHWLDRALTHPAGPTTSAQLAQAVVTARYGEPAAALDLLAALDQSGLLPERERWRLLLLQAEARRRAGDAVAARTTAESALATATALGQPAAPFVRERELVHRLLAPVALAERGR